MLALVMALPGPSTASAGELRPGQPPGLKPYEQYLAERYPALSAGIRREDLDADLHALTARESRVVGYPGEREAAAYVRAQFRSLFQQGPDDTAHFQEERFRATVPIDRGAELRLPGGERFRLRALWPNQVRTSQLPKEGLEAPVIWAGDGKLSAFNGHDVAAPEPLVTQAEAVALVCKSGGEPPAFRSAQLGLYPARDGPPVLAWRVEAAPPAGGEETQAAVVDARARGRILFPLTRAAGVPPLKRNAGAVAVVEFNTASDWLNAPRLGAEAVIFVEPEQTMRGEAESKFLGIPVSIPRFWISRADAARLRPLLGGPEPPRARLTCDMRWQTVEAGNFAGKLDGWDPLDPSDGGARLAGLLRLDEAHAERLRQRLAGFQLSGRREPRADVERDIAAMLDREQTARWKEVRGARDQIIVLHAYYDAMSVVPSLAPGAENALSMAALLELARLYADPRFRPRRTVWFIAGSAHFLGLKGIREYLERHIDSFRPPTMGEAAAAYLAREAAWLAAIPAAPRWLLAACCLTLACWSGMRAFRRGPPVPAAAALAALAAIPVLLLTASPAPPRSPPQLMLFAGLDLSSRSRGVGLFYKGSFFDYREDLQNRFADIARTTREDAEKLGAVLGEDPKALFADGVNPIEGKNWRSYFPGKIALDAEVWTLAGARGLAFATVDDARPFVDTPFDTPDRVDLDNVATQTRTIACLVDHWLNDSSDRNAVDALRVPLAEPSRFSRLGMQGGFATVLGRIVRFDLKESFIPSTPVTGSLAVLTNPGKTFMGVRGTLVQEVDDAGGFRFTGVAPQTAYETRRVTQVQGYHLDPDSGDIDYAPDLGQMGARAYPIEVAMTLPEKTVQVVVFRCDSTSIYDFVDPQTLKTLTDVRVYDGATNAEPRMYGKAVGHPERFQAVAEDAAVFFAQPGFAIKVVMGSGRAATRFVLINSTYDRARRYDAEGNNTGPLPTKEYVAEGIGYKLGEQPTGGERPTIIPGVTHARSYERTIPNIPYMAARDMWRWDDWNAEKLRRYRIINQQLDELHNRAGQYLNLAEAARGRKDWAAFDTLSRAAYAYEARAYPEVQDTARDVVKGVLFYLALMLPFAYFVERLLVASATLKNQLTWVFGIFILSFVVMSKIHPAFDITISPMIVLLAFIMLALSLLVITLVTGKFDQQLKEWNRQTSGAHTADIGRMSIAAAAFALGISNMRRRKVRTALTIVTLVLLTFIVLSFTSVVSSLRYNVVPAPGTPRYDGIMLRNALWEPLEESSYRLLSDEFGADHPVAPRAWFFGAQVGEQTFLPVTRGPNKADARAVVGLSAQEPRLTGVDRALTAGRWFRPDEVYAAILPAEMAQALGVTAGDVRSGSARVRYAGIDFAVAGLFDAAAFQAVQDLDQEPLTPVDFVLSQQQIAATGGGADSGADVASRDYTHLDAGAVFILPYRTLMNLGGQVRSVAVDLETPQQVTKTRLDLMPRLALNLYAGEGGRTYRYSAMGGASVAAAATLAVSVLIAALTVLQTMLGAVFERKREIHIFSSIGLAPSHIAMLFIAEALVYAVVGAMAGYLLGQGAAKAIVALGVFPYLNLNFSSLSAVLSTMMVMAVVVLSTLYPARLAGEAATPSVDRTWRTPEPEGDRWKIVLPFMAAAEQAGGLNGFLAEWLSAYEEYAVGDFVTQGVETRIEEKPAGTAYGIAFTAWLAPFDLGVSQRVEILTTPVDDGDVSELTLLIHRLSGDINNWKRVNRRFLNALRKEFLIWRTLKAEERGRYL